METLTELWEKSSPLTFGTVIVGLSTISYILVKSRSATIPAGLVYPPGPPKDPIIGNFRAFPKEGDDMYKAFNKFQKEYGDIVHLQLPGLSMMIVNSLDMAYELLSRRGSNSSGRTVPYMTKEMLGWNWAISFRDADSTHQQVRKMLRRGIGPQRVPSHDPLIEKSTHQALLRLRELKGDPTQIIMDAIGHTIIELTYGKQIWDKHGVELLDINIQAMSILSEVIGKLWMVDIFPQLRFIPSWIPGAGFKRRSIQSTKLVTRIQNWPFAMSKELADAHTLGHSLAADLFEEFGQTAEARDALGLLYFVGADTTTSAVVHFLHCMFMFPEIAQKVQKEIDSVVGDRLPKVMDREQLPYTEAVWKECLRWEPTVPIAIPHTTKHDEIIDGFFIPKGSLINPNIGFMLNDPKIWGDPDVFRPARHMKDHDPPLPNPLNIAFGFGMRICPGKDIANRSGFYLSTTIMAVFDILPLEGRLAPDPDTVEYTPLLIRYPKEFECRFVPRSEKAANILATLAVS